MISKVSSKQPWPHVSWDDLEAYGVMAEGVRRGQTIEQIGKIHAARIGGPRTLYRRLARLEKVYGTLLIRRQRWSRNIQLTREGTWLAERLAGHGRIRDQITSWFAQRQTHPTLRLATARSLITKVIPRFLESWYRTHSRDELTLDLTSFKDTAEAEELVRNGAVDAAISIPAADRPVPDDLRIDRIRQKVFTVILCPRDHRFTTRQRAGHSQPVRLDELAEETVVGPQQRMTWLPPAHGHGARIIVPSYEHGRAYVEMGLGLAAGFDFLEAMLKNDARIVVLPLEPPVVHSAVLLLPKIAPIHPHPVARQLLADLRVFVRDLPV